MHFSCPRSILRQAYPPPIVQSDLFRFDAEALSCPFYCLLRDAPFLCFKRQHLDWLWSIRKQLKDQCLGLLKFAVEVLSIRCSLDNIIGFNTIICLRPDKWSMLFSFANLFGPYRPTRRVWRSDI